MMKHLFLIIFLCIPFCNYAQTFVDDVNKTAIVVIDYCVDKNGKRNNITINQNKSTYKNEAWQEGCLAHFKKGVLNYPMKMTGNCWQSVYYFVNSKYKNYQLPKEDRAKCKTFHIGKFKYESPAFSETKIIRYKNRQVEIGGLGGEQVYKIKWHQDYKYQLETVKMSLAKDEHKVGNLIEVEIIEIINDKTYLYKAQISNNNSNDIVFGLISKL